MNPMRDTQIEDMQRAINEKNGAIKDLKSINNHLQSENDQLKALTEETSKHIDELRRESDEYVKKISTLIGEKRKLQENSENNKALLQKKIEELTVKLADEHSKILSYGGDQDSIRNKIESELRPALEAQNTAIRKEKDDRERECIDLKREIDKLKNLLESKKVEHLKVVKEIKERNKAQIDELSDEIIKLRESAENNKEKEKIRHLERLNEESRKKLSESEQIREDLNLKRDEIKKQLEQIQVEKSKAYDTYLTEKRELKTEIEMLKAKLKNQEEDFKREISNNLQANEELRVAQEEADRLNQELRKNEEKSIEAESKLNDAMIRLKEKESELELVITKNAEDEEGQLKLERDEKKDLQIQLEELERRLMELEEDKKNILTKTDSEISELRREYSISREEKMHLNKKLLELKDQAAALKKGLEGKLEEYEQLEKEYRRTQDAHRQLMNQCHSFGQEKEVNSKAYKEMQAQYNVLLDCQKQWESERVSLHTTISDLTLKLEKSTTVQSDEVKLCKEKLHHYKSKLKQANIKLKSFAERMIQFELPDDEPL